MRRGCAQAPLVRKHSVELALFLHQPTIGSVTGAVGVSGPDQKTDSGEDRCQQGSDSDCGAHGCCSPVCGASCHGWAEDARCSSNWWAGGMRRRVRIVSRGSGYFGPRMHDFYSLAAVSSVCGAHHRRRCLGSQPRSHVIVSDPRRSPNLPASRRHPRHPACISAVLARSTDYRCSRTLARLKYDRYKTLVQQPGCCQIIEMGPLIVKCVVTYGPGPPDPLESTAAQS